MQLILTTSFPRLSKKAFSALNLKIINRQIVKYRQSVAEREMIHLFPEIILRKVIFHKCDITCSIVMWNWYFSRFTFLIRALRIVPSFRLISVRSYEPMKTFLLGLVCLKTCKEVPIRLSNSKPKDFL